MDELFVKYLQDHTIFIDTCSLLEPSAELFWNMAIPALDRYDKQLRIPLKVVEEINKLLDSKDKTKASKASKASKIINLLLQSKGKYIQIKGEAGDNFADNVFMTIFTKFRVQHKLCLITQDTGLSKEILNLNNSKAVRGKKITVLKLDKRGRLREFDSSYSPTKPQTSQKYPELFKIKTTLTSLKDEPLPLSFEPRANDILKTEKNESVQLLASINSKNSNKSLGVGGEACVYETNTPFIAKIYKKEKLSRQKYEKLKKMVANPIKMDGICWPKNLLFNQKGEFVGYLMSKARGVELGKSIYIKPEFKRLFPSWGKKDLVLMAISILEKIEYLHDSGVILGDINPANILINSQKEVYLVDTDSYQIEDLPCPVGTPLFTAPEIMGKSYTAFLRTKGNEHFALATLLFMIMLPGKAPYAMQDGGGVVENILNGDFSYPFEKESNKKAPKGPWRFIWSHLTYKMKERFYHSFRKGGDFYKENDRSDVKAWLGLFREYYKLLDDGTLLANDEMANELFPTRLKKDRNTSYAICKLCGQEREERRIKQGYCQECLDEGEERQCQSCGESMFFSNYEKYIKGKKAFKLCKDCADEKRQQNEYKNEVYASYHCVDCGELFELTNGERDSLTRKGMSLPKRCKDCRGNGSSRRIYSSRRTRSSENIGLMNNAFSKIGDILRQFY